MNLFDWLLVGHFVGDWLLQNQWMALQKRKSWINGAILVHCCLYTVVLAMGFWIGAPTHRSGPELAIVVTIIFVSHWIIDSSQLIDLWGRMIVQSTLPFVRIMSDQTLHLLILATVASIADRF